MRILVCGGRDYDDAHEVSIALTAYLRKFDVLICGMARGADRLAYDFAKEHGIPVEEYPADWSKYPKAAGPIRNQEMLDKGKPDVVIYFPGGNGTADMVARAQKQGVKCVDGEDILQGEI